VAWQAPVKPADTNPAELQPEPSQPAAAPAAEPPVEPKLAPLGLNLSEEAPGNLQAPAATPPGGGASGFQPGGIRELLQQLGVFQSASVEQLLPALQILGLAVVAGVGLKLTGAVLGAINELPLLGQLLQLVGLVAALRFLARNALHQQKRAALLARIEQIKTNLLG
jgi:hypothetical protein